MTHRLSIIELPDGAKADCHAIMAVMLTAGVKVLAWQDGTKVMLEIDSNGTGSVTTTDTGMGGASAGSVAASDTGGVVSVVDGADNA